GDAAVVFEQAGLVLGHDPWSRPIATVGGAISTNGMGYTAAKYGSMGDRMFAALMVLAALALFLYASVDRIMIRLVYWQNEAEKET
ncbi:MAG: hypothetical protein DSY89_04360, partial [Deltaproteobacteria bacterium]